MNQEEAEPTALLADFFNRVEGQAPHWPIVLWISASPLLMHLIRWSPVPIALASAALLLHLFRATGFLAYISTLRRRPVELIWLAGLAWAACTTLWAPDRNMAMLWVGFLGVMTCPLLYLTAIPAAQLQKVLRHSTYGITFCIVLVFAYYLLRYGDVRHITPNPTRSTDLNPFGNQASAIMTCLLPVQCWLLTVSARKWISLTGIVVTVLVVGMSGSRGGLIALFLAASLTISIFILARCITLRGFSTVATAFTGALVLSWIVGEYKPGVAESAFTRLLSSNLVEELQPKSQIANIHQIGEGRRAMYMEGFKLVLDASWHGAGLNAVAVLTRENWGKRVRSHNILITAVGELGLVGGLLLLSIVALLVYQTLQLVQATANPATILLYLACLGGLAISFAIGMYRPQFDSPVNALLLVTITTCYQARNNRQSSSKAALR